MSVEIANCGERITAVITGEIDHHSAAELRTVLESEISISCPKLLILDFAEVSFMDSSGIGLILGRQRSLSACGGKVMVKNAQPRIKKLLIMGGCGSFIVGGGNEK